MRRNGTVLFALVLIMHQVAGCQIGKSNMPQNAQDYIEAFRRGLGFTRPAAGVFSAGRPDPDTVHILGQELAVANAFVRENIVALLVDMGRSTDPLTPKGADVLRDPQILAQLAGPGLAKPDAGREAAMDALRKLVTRSDLQRFESAFAKALGEAPTDEGFLLVAKAKTGGARELVEQLVKTSRWRQVEAAKVARAALGAADVEDEFLKPVANAEAASDGRTLARALGTLGLIGTQRCLRAVALRLRTPITIHIPGAMEKSVRLSALEALLYNFPDQPVLYPNNIINADSYTAAEQFCILTLGVTFTMPQPPFLTYRPFPIPLEH
jgi:hypothetical protein